jgi:hypothetical protein
MYATPQKMNPKKESKREDIKDSKSEKNGMTSAMMKAPSQVAAKIPPQDAHPTRVWFVLCLVPSKTLKKMNLDETLALVAGESAIV